MEYAYHKLYIKHEIALSVVASIVLLNTMYMIKPAQLIGIGIGGLVLSVVLLIDYLEGFYSGLKFNIKNDFLKVSMNSDYLLIPWSDIKNIIDKWYGAEIHTDSRKIPVLRGAKNFDQFICQVKENSQKN